MGQKFINTVEVNKVFRESEKKSQNLQASARLLNTSE